LYFFPLKSQDSESDAILHPPLMSWFY